MVPCVPETATACHHAQVKASAKFRKGSRSRLWVIASEHQKSCNWVAQLASRRGIIAAHQEAVASPPIVHRLASTGCTESIVCKADSINFIPTLHSSQVDLLSCVNTEQCTNIPCLPPYPHHCIKKDCTEGSIARSSGRSHPPALGCAEALPETRH